MNKSIRRGTRHVLVPACAGLLLVLAGCGLGNGHGNLASGVKYQEGGKYRAAYIEAKKILQKDGKNGEAWLLLGRASLMLGNPDDALSELGKARENGVSEAKWAVPTGRALLAAGKYDTLLKTLPGDAALPPRARESVHVLRGEAWRGMNQPGRARKAYEAALALAPDNPRALAGMALLDAASGNHEAAGKHLQQALAADPGNPVVMVAKADIASLGGDLAGAETAYRDALATRGHAWLPQERFLARLKLAEVQARQDKFDDALANIEALEKLSPEQPHPHYLHAVVLYRQGHMDDAVAQLQQVLKASPGNVPAQVLMGAVNYAEGNDGQAEMYLSNVMGVDGGNATARKLLALVLYRGGRTAQALDALRPAAPRGASDAALLALLQKASAGGAGLPGHAGSAAAGAYGMAAATGSAEAVADVDLVHAARALAKGDAGTAVTLLEKSPPGNDAADARRATLLVQAYVQTGRTADAVKLASGRAAAHPHDANAHLAWGTALVAAGKRDQAREQYEAARRLAPDDPTPLMNLASLDALEGHYEDAVKRYTTILGSHPDNVPAMNALGRLAATRGNRAEAVKWYRRAIDKAPASADAYTHLVMLYSRNGQFDKAAQVATKLADALPDNAAALNALGAAELNVGRHGKALPPLRKAVKLAPDVSLYRINLARAQILARDTAAAADTLQAVVEKEPGQVQAVSLLASLRLQGGDLPGALALARALQAQPSAKRNGYVLEGDLYMGAKSWREAARAYGRAQKIRDGRDLVIKRFLALRHTDDGAAGRILESWLAAHADDTAARMLLAGDYLGKGDNAAASRQYAKVLEAYPSNIEALNNLAWIRTAEHDPKALELARRAHELAPDSPGITDTYAWALVVNGKPEAALPLLRKAVAAAPGQPTLQYHLAVAQARSGDHEGARATLAAIDRPGVTFPDRDAAQALYRKLSGGTAENGVDR